MKSRQDGKYEKENSKTWSEEAIDKLTVFSHKNTYGMLPMVIIKTKTKYLPLKEFDMPLQEYSINRHGY